MDDTGFVNVKKVWLLGTGDEDIEQAAAALKDGRLVAFPTETVYGLGADAFNTDALARVFEAKRRPRFDPLIVHIACVSALARIADLDKLSTVSRAKTILLCEKLMPGPLTLVLPKQPGVPDLATSALPTVAARFPSHPVAQKLIQASTGAIAAPSANPFGYLSPTRAEHVAEQLGDRVDFIVDGGACGIGVESTVLDMTEEPPRLLRPGGTPREAIETLIGRVEGAADSASSAPHAPGQLKSHYAPHAPVIPHDAAEMRTLPFRRGEFFLFFDEETLSVWATRQGASRCGIDSGAALALSRAALSDEQKTVEAAATLFDALHRIDSLRPSVIHAQKAPDTGLGPAVNDRLSRAAAKSV